MVVKTLDEKNTELNIVHFSNSSNERNLSPSSVGFKPPSNASNIIFSYCLISINNKSAKLLNSVLFNIDCINLLRCAFTVEFNSNNVLTSSGYSNCRNTYKKKIYVSITKKCSTVSNKTCQVNIKA